MEKSKLQQLLRNAIIALESEYEDEEYGTAEELHRVLLNETGMTEAEYLAVMGEKYAW